MMQVRWLFCFALVAIIAAPAMAAKSLEEQALQVKPVQQSLLDVQNAGQEHANVGERLARQYYGKKRGGGGRKYYGGGGGRKYYGGGRKYYGGGRKYYGGGRKYGGGGRKYYGGKGRRGRG